MADSLQWIKHIELYVDSSATPSQQAASVDAIATLLKDDVLTLDVLVREMEMYLTTTDSIIRSRGILLLAELVAQLTSKPLSRTSIHSLIGFFSERLADWKALHGAILGCLGLLKRNDIGIVIDSEAKAVTKSYLQNLQVQSLGQHERKLSFQLMECLLDCYSGAIKDLGDNLVYGICEAMDGEKDPQCLLLVFHIVESLARLYPGESGPLVNFAEDLFEILGCYFPLHFTHPKGDDDGVKREELSKGLMLAMAATPLFEPFSIPLLLEKLSSSLPLAKVESFKYLSYCTSKYGPERMAKHAGAIWAFIKDATYGTSDSTLLVESELGGMSFQESDAMMEALVVLQEIVRHYSDFISLVLGDNDINMFLDSLDQCKEFDGISVEVKHKLHMVARILSTCAESSVALCDKVFENFFPLLMKSLGLSVSQSSENSHLDEECFSPVKLNFGVIYLCIELLAAFRYLTVSVDSCTSVPDFSHQISYAMINRFSELLMKAFVSLLRSTIVADNKQSAYFYFGVKGLQILATYPGSFRPVQKSIYDNILLELVSIISSKGNMTLLWNMALKALGEIGFFIDKYPDPEKASCFEVTVVERIVSLISSDDLAVPLTLKLQAAVEIGATRKDFMLRIAQGLDQAIHANFSAIFHNENHAAGELTVELLDTYSQKVILWFMEVGGSDEIPLKFALNIWEMMENVVSRNEIPLKITSDLIVATTNAMKRAVASCPVGSQEKIIKKGLGVLFSSSGLGLERSNSGSCVLKEDELLQTTNFSHSNITHEWLVSLIASVVIALHPQTSLPNGKVILQLFITNLLNGHIPSAHALGSLVNKLPLETMGKNSSGVLCLNEALEIVFHSYIGSSCQSTTPGNDGNGINFSNLNLKTITIQSKMSSIIGLAWIGKGLLMRGHEKVKDITLALLSFLMLDREAEGSKQFQNQTDVFDEEGVHRLMKCAGDAFHIIMSDSEECLNRAYHASIKPLYKQRFFSTITPILLSLVVKSELSLLVRSMLYRAFAHVVIDTPLTAILGDAKKLVPALLECLSLLKDDTSNKEIIYSILLIISGILLEKNGHEVAVENAPSIINQVIELTTYLHKVAVRETAIQCLVALSQLPYSRIYPLRKKVLHATSKVLDDDRRTVRNEAARCQQLWASIA